MGERQRQREKQRPGAFSKEPINFPSFHGLLKVHPQVRLTGLYVQHLPLLHVLLLLGMGLPPSAAIPVPHLTLAVRIGGDKGGRVLTPSPSNVMIPGV